MKHYIKSFNALERSEREFFFFFWKLLSYHPITHPTPTCFHASALWKQNCAIIPSPAVLKNKICAVYLPAEIIEHNVTEFLYWLDFTDFDLTGLDNQVVYAAFTLVLWKQDAAKTSS